MQHGSKRLVLVDGHRCLIDPLAEVIQKDPELEVVGTAYDAESGRRMIRECRPGLVAVEIELPDASGFDLLAEFRGDRATCRSFIISAYLSDIFLEEALRLGVAGYALKEEPLGALLHHIRRAADGQRCFSRRAEDRLEYDPVRETYRLRSRGRLESLTSRQLQVLRHLAKGLSVKKVAHRMQLSVKSVDSHKYRIMRQLGIHERVELARLAIREGLVLP